MPLTIVSKSNMVEDLYSGGNFAPLPLFTLKEIEITGLGKKAIEKIPGRLLRHCTAQYKIRPIQKYIRQKLLAMGLAKQRKNGAIVVNKGVVVESWFGISMDESERMKPPRRVKWVVHRWPLIEKKMTRGDCKQWLKRHALPVPEKSSCLRCPFHDDTYFLNMKNNHVEDWESITKFDDDLRNGRLRLTASLKGDVFLHRSCIPMRDVILKNERQGSFDFCDEGYCWT
jgi:hypothetical protein